MGELIDGLLVLSAGHGAGPAAPEARTRGATV